MSRRSFGIVATIAASTALLSSCAWASPIQTQESYAASDGIRVALGEDEKVRVENLFVLTSAAGETAQVFGALVNDTKDEVTIGLSVADLTEEFDLDAGQVLHLNDELDTFTDDTAEPGATIPITLTFQGSFTGDVPVLDGTIPPYDEYLP